ncbi:MAG: GAF domain-containing sensor histidine kinase [Planctomycetaceae bacterium]|nr:GAF domain-containing sensor histidine kinase [Planctomycetaceae bacterium]
MFFRNFLWNNYYLLKQSVKSTKTKTDHSAKHDLPATSAHLNMLYETVSVTNRILEIDTLLQQTLEHIAEWITINHGCILLYDSELQQLIPQTIRSFAKNKFAENKESDDKNKESEQPLRLAINRSVIEYVTQRQEGILLSTNEMENHQEPAPCGEPMFSEILCVPMLGRYGLVGVIYLVVCPDTPTNNSNPQNIFTTKRLTPDHLRVMIAVAHQTALAIENTRLQHKIIQSEHLATVGKTVSTLSHHIKNILQGIDGGSYLVRTGMSKNDEKMLQQGWEIVEKNQKRISQLILDMLTLSKEREPDYESGDIAGTVGEAVELLQFRAREENVEMTFKSETTIPKFFFDIEQIHRAITNLITNGIDATKMKKDVSEPNDSVPSDSDTDRITETIGSASDDPDERRQSGLLQIEVGYGQEESVVLIRVDDNGVGVPEPQRHELFHAFYSQKKGQGTGLGLSVAYKIIQEHGGNIRVTDSPLGGARFEIELPIRRKSKIIRNVH